MKLGFGPVTNIVEGLLRHLVNPGAFHVKLREVNLGSEVHGFYPLIDLLYESSPVVNL